MKKSEKLDPDARARRYARDLEIINQNADSLNVDALDALEYQAPIDFDEDVP